MNELALRNSFLYSFTAAGVVAALTFRALYYRDCRSHAKAATVAFQAS